MKPGRTKGPFGLAPAAVVRPSIAEIARPANSTLPVTHPLGVRMEPSGDVGELAVIELALLFHRREARALRERHISMARPLRMLSSAASTIRRLLTASRI